jgi:hypothetical protein
VAPIAKAARSGRGAGGFVGVQCPALIYGTLIAQIRFVEAVTFLQQHDAPTPPRFRSSRPPSGVPTARITAKDLSKHWRIFETYAPP